MYTYIETEKGTVEVDLLTGEAFFIDGFHIADDYDITEEEFYKAWNKYQLKLLEMTEEGTIT